MRAAEPDAVLPVDKPAGRTSHDMVAIARRALGTRRIGHTGTLDPFATGLLLLCIGRATRLAEYLTGLPKTYEATLRLGVVTDTDDATGTVLAADDWRRCTAAEVEAALGAQTGRLLQRPPAFSAKKVEGERAYRRARRGDAPELAPVEVHVYALDILGLDLPDVRFRVTVSAGTYIRAIARDAGAALGVGAHLAQLRRTAIGAFAVETAVPADRLDDPAVVAAALMPPLDALGHLPRIELNADEAAAIRQGRRVAAPAGAMGCTVLAQADTLVAIAEAADGVLRPRKVFLDD